MVGLYEKMVLLVTLKVTLSDLENANFVAVAKADCTETVKAQ